MVHQGRSSADTLCTTILDIPHSKDAFKPYEVSQWSIRSEYLRMDRVVPHEIFRDSPFCATPFLDGSPVQLICGCIEKCHMIHA